MAKASGLYEGFSYPAIVDGVTYQPWEEYISKIAANRAAAEALEPDHLSQVSPSLRHKDEQSVCLGGFHVRAL